MDLEKKKKLNIGSKGPSIKKGGTVQLLGLPGKKGEKVGKRKGGVALEIKRRNLKKVWRKIIGEPSYKLEGQIRRRKKKKKRGKSEEKKRPRRR